MWESTQMNMAVLSTYSGRNEISQCGAVSNWLISQANSTPSLGQVDDSIIMLADLTSSKIMYDRHHAMQLFASCTIKPDLSDVPETGISGRDIVSKLLERTPINLNRPTTWYNENYAPYIEYDPNDIKLVIINGKIMSGVLDKKNIGAGAVGGLYHVIANEYGNDAALEVMFNMQQVAIAHTYLAGYTVGVMDFMIDQKSKQEIDNIASGILRDSALITERLIKGEIIPPIGKTVNQYYEELQIDKLRILDDFLPTVLKAISPDNNLFRMIAYGSKGSMDNMFNMVSGAGQKLINGDRIKENFGHKRVLKYFPRFSTERGYIANSYLNGITVTEYIFNAMASRFDLISKALSTSITGQQNRESIKSLESAITNNWRMTVKGNKVIQWAYGQDFLDPRRVESVKFPTAFASDEQLSVYQHKSFPKFYEEILADREWFRYHFLKLEQCSFKESISDSKMMPFNVQRIIGDIVASNPDRKELTESDLTEAVNYVDTMIEAMPYLLMNEIQERAKAPIPHHMLIATRLCKMLMRSYLHPNELIKQKLNISLVTQIIDTIRIRYRQALIEPGTAVGIIAAQSFSEPFTQYMLDSHHRSASGGTSKNQMLLSKEILGAKSVDKLVGSSMLIPVAKHLRGDRQRVQELANSIEVMKFNQFVHSWQIFYEKYGNPVHPKYIHEKSIIEEFAKHNPLIAPPGDLTKWCCRFSLNKSNLILKNMSVELIVSKLRRVYPDIYIVYTGENAPETILRIYFRSAMFKTNITLNQIQDVKQQLFDTTIRGIEGIVNAFAVPIMRSKINEDGAVTSDDIYGIATIGTNLDGVLGLRDIDHNGVLTSAIQEIASVYGIEAARRANTNELHGLVDKCAYRHNMIYSDVMTSTGKVTSIGLSGVKSRETKNILLRVGFSSPITALEEAAIHAVESQVGGVTGSLLVGTVPNIGTTYNSFHINEEFVRANVKKTEDLLEGLA